jgi:hypothetical protein
MGLYTHSTGDYAPAVMTESAVSTEELFLIIYCIADDLYQEAAPDWVRFRNGTGRMAMTDSGIITLSTGARGTIQRLGSEFSPGRPEGLPSPVSGSDLPFSIPSKAQGPGVSTGRCSVF